MSRTAHARKPKRPGPAAPAPRVHALVSNYGEVLLLCTELRPYAGAAACRKIEEVTCPACRSFLGLAFARAFGTFAREGTHEGYDCEVLNRDAGIRNDHRARPKKRE